jgi:hypothetical protein
VELGETVPQVRRLARIKAQARPPRKDAVNAMGLIRGLSRYCLRVEASCGGGTKFSRSRLKIHKKHALDAACVGEVGALVGWQHRSQSRRAEEGTTKRHTVCHTAPCMRTKSVRGLQTGDMVRAEVPIGNKAGNHARRCGSWQRLFENEQCRRNQRQVLQTSPSRGRLLRTGVPAQGTLTSVENSYSTVAAC